jgi:hypothetical protein
MSSSGNDPLNSDLKDPVLDTPIFDRLAQPDSLIQKEMESDIVDLSSQAKKGTNLDHEMPWLEIQPKDRKTTKEIRNHTDRLIVQNHHYSSVERLSSTFAVNSKLPGYRDNYILVPSWLQEVMWDSRDPTLSPESAIIADAFARGSLESTMRRLIMDVKDPMSSMTSGDDIAHPSYLIFVLVMWHALHKTTVQWARLSKKDPRVIPWNIPNGVYHLVQAKLGDFLDEVDIFNGVNDVHQWVRSMLVTPLIKATTPWTKEWAWENFRKWKDACAGLVSDGPGVFFPFLGLFYICLILWVTLGFWAVWMFVVAITVSQISEKFSI